MKPSYSWAVVCLAATVSSVSANLVAYQGFNGYTVGALPGQPIGSNTQGLDTAGIITSAGTGAAANVFDATGMTFSNLITSGGSARYADATGRPSYIGFAYTGPAVSGNLYTSYLVRLGTVPSNNGVASLRANTTATSGGAAAYFHAYADGPANVFTGSQYDANNANTASTQSLAINTDYVVIGRFTRVGTALSVGSPGVATTFVLTAAQFDYFKDGGFTDAELDGALIGSGPSNVTSRVSDAPVTTGTFTFNPGNGIQFGPGNSGANQTVAYDEFRFGTTLDDVLPVPAPPVVVPVNVTIAASGAISQEPTPGAEAIGSVTLTRDGDTTAALRVYLNSSGTATAGVDYPAVPASVLIPAGATSLVVPVPAYTDSLVEGPETVTLTLVADAGYNLPPTTSATVTLNDRAAGVPSTKSRFIQKLAAGLQQKVVFYGTSLTASGNWPTQLRLISDATWPGQATYYNRGSSGMASNWGITNLQTQVLALVPDTVFIEFSVNDAVARLDISLPEARANLNAMIDGILAVNPQCEVILQVTNPVIGRPQGDAGWRPNLVHYQQIYRDVAAERNLTLIDHSPAWQALLDQSEVDFYTNVPDGLHPSVGGEAVYMVPALLERTGAPAIVQPPIVVDETMAQFEGTWTFSTSTAGAHLNGYQTDGNIDKGLKTVSYFPEIPAAGTYPVYLRWSSLNNRANNVPVTINYAGGSTTVTVDQTINGGMWYKLGDFPLAAGTDNSVVIGTTGTTGFVIADAVGVGVPAVRLLASNGRAGEPVTSGGAARPSIVTVTRSGSVTQAQVVNLTIGGDAVNGGDYDAVPVSITIPAGAKTATLTIMPKFDTLHEGAETLTIEAVPPSGMYAGVTTKASLVVVDPDDSPFSGWQAAHFSVAQLDDVNISGENADPDGDGITNLMEYFAGYDPLVQQASFVSSGKMAVEGVDYFSITYPRAPGTGLLGVPEVSTNLQVWNAGDTFLAKSADADPDALQQVLVRSRTATSAASRQFLRLKVTR
ncbi:golvesin C-terminal-like domain-containing protein [Luteolibacter soli]|uniref:GDSL-type esterase/lipase family protein n=1 Tax=Luteolibacter soli TaxID=3135280 RepID=A0ABU9APR2_9BACT